jgi:glutathionylspermidine synthase
VVSLEAQITKKVLVLAVSTTNIKAVSKEIMEEVGFNWHTDLDGTAYIANELVNVSEDEAENYYKAANEIYDMFVEAGEYAIEHDLLFDLNIPVNLHEMIKLSWENDVHWHIYSRFDLAGGIDGKPIKLIEFNADTPTAVFETAIIQWATLKQNGKDEESQFNNLYEGIVENFKRLITLDEDTSSFEEHYDGWKILFSSTRGNNEEEETVRFLQRCADEAGFVTEFCYLDEVQFDENEGIFDPNGVNYEYWFKLYPWEDIALEEELPMILTSIMRNKKAILLNPAYTVMFQSKMFLHLLHGMFPDSPYILKTDLEPLEIPYVEKKAFGREGANTTIVSGGETLASRDGEYENYKSIYQEYVKLPKKDDEYYQAGVFFAYEGIGLGFRKGGLILDNMSKFVGHVIQ